jgi:hypothetical protein
VTINPETRSSTARVPRQRSRRQTVLVLLTVHEPSTEVVRFGSRAAETLDIPVLIAMLAPDGSKTAQCMAAMDKAVEVARSTAPRIEIRVETSALEPDHLTSLRDGWHPVVVVSRETWDARSASAELGWVGTRQLVVL